MRAILQLLTLAVLPAVAAAQGIVIRPCVPRPCTVARPCPPCRVPDQGVVKQSSHVRAELTNRVLRYEVTETFVNRGAGLGEADYIFPLPKGAAFQDLKLSINGELVSGETMSAERARGIYEQIVRQQRDPALVEWMGYGMLRARIFPIAPGEEKKVVVRFQMVAEREGDALRVDYFQGKRNATASLAAEPSRDRETPSGSFTLIYPANATYGNAYSPTHNVTTVQRGGRREVRVRGNAAEITLLVPVRTSDEPSISVLSYAPRNEDGFALITLSPPAVAPRPTARDVTLVLDVSGSMSGVKIRQARAAGKQVLATLSPSDRFRLVDFSTDVRTFRDEFVRATPQNLAEASRYLESLEATGSTNISGALDVALEGDTPSGRLGLVLFVTDGEPTVGERNPEAIAARVARRRGDRRIFSFGVGADLNAALVERLAVEGRGTAHFVRPEESVERAVSIVADRLSSPVVTDVRVSVDGVRLSKRHPSASADIFAGQDFVMLTRYSGSGSGTIRFDGRTANGPVSWTERVNFGRDSRENSFVARLWATQRVGYLSAEKRRNGGSREVDDEIRELGEKYSIPTEFTSYLVLEPGMDPRDFSGRGLRADNVVVTGVATGVTRSGKAGSGPPPPPTAAAAPAVQAFEKARAAAEQRATTNLADADASIATNTDMRRVGTRTFARRGDTWVDTGKRDSMQVTKVRAFSEAYFKLIEAIPELREVLALGDKVTVAGKSIAIEIGDDGVSSLDESKLRQIQERWQ
jgi:Ca-activated chloride channel family protein